MTNSKFFFKWVLPIAIPLFAYFSIGSLVDSSIDKEELIAINGQIDKIEYYESTSRGGSNTNMRLHLRNGNTYKVTYEWEDKFNEIEAEFENSDEIQLFHRNSNQTWWRLGTSDILYHLEIGKTIIIDIEERQSKSRTVGVLTGFVTLVGLIILIARWRGRRQTAR